MEWYTCLHFQIRNKCLNQPFYLYFHKYQIIFMCLCIQVHTYKRNWFQQNLPNFWENFVCETSLNCTRTAWCIFAPHHKSLVAHHKSCVTLGYSTRNKPWYLCSLKLFLLRFILKENNQTCFNMEWKKISLKIMTVNNSLLLINVGLSSKTNYISSLTKEICKITWTSCISGMSFIYYFHQWISNIYYRW